MIKYTAPEMELLIVETEDVVLASVEQVPHKAPSDCVFENGKCTICGYEKGGFNESDF